MNSSAGSGVTPVYSGVLPFTAARVHLRRRASIHGRSRRACRPLRAAPPRSSSSPGFRCAAPSRPAPPPPPLPPPRCRSDPHTKLTTRSRRIRSAVWSRSSSSRSSRCRPPSLLPQLLMCCQLLMCSLRSTLQPLSTVPPALSARVPARAPAPPSHTNWTRLVPPPVLTGHVSSLPPVPARAVRPGGA